VYKAGFATSQRVYEEEYDRVFAALDWLEEHLSSQDFLVGNRLTEADWRLWTTLIRFDPVYHGHFKVNRNKLSEFEYIPVYMQRLGEIPGVAETVHLDHIKQHYYGSHKTINPNGVIPKGPEGFNHPRGLRN
jgi:putative glutathione S-transferase